MTLETRSENMEDAFSKNMFGTDEVTVTVEYDDNPVESDRIDTKEFDDEELLKVEEEGNEEQELDEEEEKILENISFLFLQYLIYSLSEKEMRKIREQAASKKKKGRKRRKSSKRSRH